MARTRIPESVLDAAHARAAAREARDWAEADRLRTEIEAAGWRVVDRGTDFALTPLAPPTIETDGVTRYGASTEVPSLLDDEATATASVILIATDWPEDVKRALDALDRHAPDATQVVVVADAPSPEQEDALLERAGRATELIWTSARLGQAAALNAGIRRTRSSVVILLDPSVEPTGDIVTPLVDALEDPTVAVAGGWGIVSADLRKFTDAPRGDVDAIEGYALAFRRDDAQTRGPLDERFRFYRNLDIWWSLVLRDEGPGAPPRRAVSVEIPAVRHEHRGWTSLPEEERDRLSKRNFYRIIDRFGNRRDLVSG